LNCPRCEGSGQCAECEGAGYIECPSCRGKGKKTTSRGATYSCKSCDGDGKMDCSMECSSCNGTGEITEKFQKETREKYTPRFVNYTPNSAVVWPLVIFNVIVFAFVEWGPRDVAGTLYLTSESLNQGHYWAFITPSFMHWSGIHLILNMVFLGYYGPPLEGLLGKRRFLATYLFTALTACLLSYLGNIELRGFGFAGIGASGPMYGIVGSYMALQYRWRMVSTLNLKSLVNWAGIILLVGFSIEWTEFNFIDNWGHLGGLLGGMALNLVLPKPKGR
jgi:membrane associated rhomboid family serine protease